MTVVLVKNDRAGQTEQTPDRVTARARVGTLLRRARSDDWAAPEWAGTVLMGPLVVGPPGSLLLLVLYWRGGL